MRHWFSVIAMMMVFASGARAAGIDLSWNDCLTGSVTASNDRNFTCLGATNQNYSLVFQFRSPVALPGFVALTAYLDLVSEAGGPLAPFWHYESGGCNRSPVSGIAMSSTVPASCTEHGYLDPWGTNATSAIAAYAPDYQQPGLGRLVVLVALGAASPIQTGPSYYGGHLVFNNRNRHTCFGCTQRVRLLWEVGTLESNNGTPPVNLSTPDQGSNCARINGANAAACGTRPAESTTWGRLESMFR